MNRHAAGSGLGRYYRGRVTAGYFAHLFKAVCKQHHRELLPLLRPIIPADAIVFDVGAHAGQFTKLFATLTPRGFVFAFEPGSYARGILRIAVRLNRLDNVVILPLGLGEGCGVATLTVPVRRTGSYGFGLAHLGAADDRRRAESETVALATLDSVVESLRLTRLDFIKADIEGFEAQMLRGAHTTLERLRPALLLEMNAAHLSRAGDSLGAAWQFLSNLGYRPYAAAPRRAEAPLAAPGEGDVLWLAERDA